MMTDDKEIEIMYTDTYTYIYMSPHKVGQEDKSFQCLGTPNVLILSKREGREGRKVGNPSLDLDK